MASPTPPSALRTSRRSTLVSAPLGSVSPSRRSPWPGDHGTSSTTPAATSSRSRSGTSSASRRVRRPTVSSQPSPAHALRREKLAQLLERLADPAGAAGGDGGVEGFLRREEVAHDDHGLGAALLEGH